MQTIATRIFIAASVAFGIIGILMTLTTPDGPDTSTLYGTILTKLLATSVFIILPSFALSVAGKYLSVWGTELKK